MAKRPSTRAWLLSKKWTIVACGSSRWTWRGISASTKTTKCSSSTNSKRRRAVHALLRIVRTIWSTMDSVWIRRCRSSSIARQRRRRTQSCLSHSKITRKSSITWRRLSWSRRPRIEPTCMHTRTCCSKIKQTKYYLAKAHRLLQLKLLSKVVLWL